MGLEGPRLVELLHALDQAHVPTRRQPHARDQQAQKEDTYPTQNPGDGSLAGGPSLLAMLRQPDRSSGCRSPGPRGSLAPTRFPLVGAGHRAGILHYADAGYISIARRLRSVNEGWLGPPIRLPKRRGFDA